MKRNKSVAFKGHSGSLFILTTVIAGGNWPVTATTIGVDSIEQNEDGAYLLADHMNTIEAKLTEANDIVASHEPVKQELEALRTDKTTLQNELTAATEAKNSAESQLTTANESIAAKDTEIEELQTKLLSRASDDRDPGRTGEEGAGAETKYGWSKKKFNRK